VPEGELPLHSSNLRKPYIAIGGKMLGGFNISSATPRLSDTWDLGSPHAGAVLLWSLPSVFGSEAERKEGLA
jgi:hypothetical protein